MNQQEKAKMKKLIIIFVLAFLFNFIWEHLHFNLYIHYQGGEITDFILFRAAIFDALVIALVAWLTLKRKIYIPIIILVVFAICLEQYALSTGRWAYNDFMPIIPIIKTGFTPTIQLALIYFLIYRYITPRNNKKSS